jgi:hypothetical protein
MKTKGDVDVLVRLLSQLHGLHVELSQLAKKSSNDAVNAFKLRLINKVLASGNEVLGDAYRPFAEFAEFDVDAVPSNSDVTFILTQYIEQTERYRSDNVVYSDYEWRYVVNGRPSDVKAAPPTLIGIKK